MAEAFDGTTVSVREIRGAEHRAYETRAHGHDPRGKDPHDVRIGRVVVVSAVLCWAALAAHATHRSLVPYGVVLGLVLLLVLLLVWESRLPRRVPVSTALMPVEQESLVKSLYYTDGSLRR